MQKNSTINFVTITLVLVMSLVLTFLLCGCKKSVGYTVSNTSQEEVVSSENKEIEEQADVEAEELGDTEANEVDRRITVYTAKTSDLHFPREVDTIYGCTSEQEELLVLFSSREELFAAVFSESGELLSEHRLSDDVVHVYRASETSNGDMAVYAAVQSVDAGSSEKEKMMIVFDDSFEETQRTSIPSQCQMSFGPAITPNGDYIFWDVNTLYSVTETGELVNQKQITDVELVSIVCSDGYCSAVVMKGPTLGLCPIDMETLELGSFTALGASPACYSYLDGHSNTVLVNTDDALYRYDLETQAYTRILDWTTAGTSGMEIKSISNITRDSIAWTDGTTAKLSVIEAQEVEREIVTVAAVGTRHARLEALVSEFNNSSERYYALIHYYDDSAPLITEMIAGNAPDVLEMTSVPMTLTGRNFVDLLPYMEEDPEVQREDLVQSVLSALLVNDQLLAIPSSFYLQTLVGREEMVGARRNWTTEDLRAILNEKGDAYSAFPAWMTSKELMLWVANISLGQFVDWNNLDCDFTNDAFIALLEFCKEMPSEFNSDSYVSDYEEEVLLTVEMFQNVDRLQTIKRNYGGENISYIGFPGDGTNNGSFFSRSDRDLMLAIPIGSKNKSAAWELVRYTLTANWQASVLGLPLRRDVLEKQLSALENESDGLINEADVAKFLDVLLESEVFIYNDSTISEIVLEEAIPFFVGEKSATSVATLIDSRVSLYLAEQE